MQSLLADVHVSYLHYLSPRYTPPTWRAYLTLFSCHRPPEEGRLDRRTMAPKESENRVNERSDTHSMEGERDERKSGLGHRAAPSTIKSVHSL